MRCRMLLREITAGTDVESQAKLWCPCVKGLVLALVIADVWGVHLIHSSDLKDAVREGMNFHVVLPGMPDD